MRSNPQEVVELLAEMEREARAIHKQIAEICFYMRGSIDYYQAWNLSFKEIKVIQERIKEQFEFVKKSQMPIL